MVEDFSGLLSDERWHIIGKMLVRSDNKAQPDKEGAALFTGVLSVFAKDEKTLIATLNFTPSGIEFTIPATETLPAYEKRILTLQGDNLAFYHTYDMEDEILPTVAHIMASRAGERPQLHKQLNTEFRRFADNRDKFPSQIVFPKNPNDTSIADCSWYIDPLYDVPVTYLPSRAMAGNLCQKLKEQGYNCQPQIPTFAPREAMDALTGALEIRSVSLPSEARNWLKIQEIECTPVKQEDNVRVKGYVRLASSGTGLQ